MFVSQELQFRATLFAQMISHFATTLAPYLKRIKLVAVALALMFLANLSWSQFLNSDGANGHRTAHARARLNRLDPRRSSSAKHASRNNTDESLQDQRHALGAACKPESSSLLSSIISFVKTVLSQ